MDNKELYEDDIIEENSEDILIQPIDYTDSAIQQQEEEEIRRKNDEERKKEFEQYMLTKRKTPVSFEKIFWLILLFLFPLIGFVSSAILTYKKKININIKNLAKAFFILHSVLLAIVIVFILFCLIFNDSLALTNIIENILINILNSINDVAKMSYV